MTAATLPVRLDVDGLSFDVEPRPNRSTIEVTVERDASLSVKVPDGREADEVEAFIDAKRGWIHRKLAEKDALLGPTVVKEFVDGEGFLYLGRSHRLKLVDTDSSSDPQAVRLFRGRFELRRDRAADGVEVMKDWYRSTGTAWLRRRLPRWRDRFGAPEETDVMVDELGYRWGSSRPGGDVNIHWASLQLPPRLLDYVIVHELAHLTEPNHTPGFWRDVERVLPDADTRRHDLNTLGSSIWLGHTSPPSSRE